jgi:hypothetical protein
MRKKYGETPETKRRGRANRKARRRVRLKEQAELVPRVLAAWAEQRARRIDGVVVGRDAEGKEVRIVIGARALMYEYFDESVVLSTDPER